MEADVLDERDYSCKIAIDFALFIFHQVHIIAKVFEMVHQDVNLSLTITECSHLVYSLVECKNSCSELPHCGKVLVLVFGIVMPRDPLLECRVQDPYCLKLQLLFEVKPLKQSVGMLLTWEECEHVVDCDNKEGN